MSLREERYNAAAAVALDVRCQGNSSREEIQYTIHSSVVSLHECRRGKKDTLVVVREIVEVVWLWRV